MDRVAIVALGWFAFCIALGYSSGTLLFSSPGTGTVLGFGFALLATPAWPWVIPETINDWMDDRRKRRDSEVRPSSQRVPERTSESSDTSNIMILASLFQPKFAKKSSPRSRANFGFGTLA